MEPHEQKTPTEIYRENIRLRSEMANPPREDMFEDVAAESERTNMLDGHPDEIVTEEPPAQESHDDHRQPRTADCDSTDGKSTDHDATKMLLLQALLENKSLKISIGEVEHGTARAKNKSCWSKCKKYSLLTLTILTVAFLIGMVSWLGMRNQSFQRSVVDVIEDGAKTEALTKGMANVVEEVLPKALDLNIGLRQDFRLRDCNNHNLKESFPDIDYSLLGYNILRGFPMATGHDPGFTFPIFIADYSTHAQTADCRYSIPSGFVVIPDVSCMTSFSSKTIQSTYEFSKELAVSAHAGGGGWGVSFSASAGYKESSSEVSSGESVFVISTAKCNYYFSKLLRNKPPKFHDVFVDWIYKLNASTDANKDIVFVEFLDQYGTHFPAEITYGARYTYRHKMSTSSFKREQSKGVNVAVQASYSGMFSVSGGFSMDSSQRESASNFQKNVETQTFTVGAAPPANGDAITWASEVKSSPVPTRYELVMISDLFTEQYMSHFRVDLQSIRSTLVEMMSSYCLHLKRKGEVESCAAVSSGISFETTRLFDHYKRANVETESVCIDMCMGEKDCDAITFCSTYDAQTDNCYLFTEDMKTIIAKEEGRKDGEDKWQSTIFLEKIRETVLFSHTKIEGMERSIDSIGEKRVTEEKCLNLCIEDTHCVAYSYCSCVDQVSNCFLYSETSISGLKEDDSYDTVFISNDLQITTTTSTTTSTTTPKTSTNATTV